MYEVKDFTFTEMLEKSGSLYADRPALAMVGAQPLKYADLKPATRKVAAALLAWGVKKGDKVAIFAENSPHWGVAYLGASRIGAVLVPILTDFIAEQVGNIIRHSETSVVLCSQKLLPKLHDVKGPRVILDIADLSCIRTAEGVLAPVLDPAGSVVLDSALMARTDTAIQDAAIKKDDIAMIVYTSGTTGLSKGVMLSHGNIVSNAVACKSIIILRRTDRLLSILPLAHTYEFTIGFVIPLLMGSFISYLDRPPSASALLPALKVVRPTIMLSVPMVIEKVYRASVKPTLEGMKAYSNPLLKPLLIKFAGIKLKKTFGGKLRFFGVGGAPLSADVEEFLKKAGFPYAIGYGLTETSPLIAGSSPAKTRLRATGPALAGVSLRISDPKPGSKEGEIQAKGPNVFKGYFKDSARTAEAFSADGWFRTGDLGYIDSKKRIFVRGRIKTMILGASGENIYPEEIEAVINGSPFVAESLVYDDGGELTALVYLKSEVLEGLEARVRDSLEEAGDAASKIGQAITGAEKVAVEKIGQAMSDVEKMISATLEKIRKEANERLASFSRIRKVKIQKEPFEKTPTQKIKRFLYPKETQKI